MSNGQWLVRMVLIAAVTYALFSFVAMNTNPADWGEFWRAVYGLFVVSMPT